MMLRDNNYILQDRTYLSPDTGRTIGSSSEGGLEKSADESSLIKLRDPDECKVKAGYVPNPGESDPTIRRTVPWFMRDS